MIFFFNFDGFVNFDLDPNLGLFLLIAAFISEFYLSD